MLLSAILRTYQLHSGTVRDHMYPSTHDWSHLVIVSTLQDPSASFGSVEDHLDPLRHLQSCLSAFSNHRDTSATFRDCQRPSITIHTCLELSSPSQHTSGPLSFILGLSQTIWTHQTYLELLSDRYFSIRFDASVLSVFACGISLKLSRFFCFLHYFLLLMVVLCTLILRN